MVTDPETVAPSAGLVMVILGGVVSGLAGSSQKGSRSRTENRRISVMGIRIVYI
jgi:hypothetical protein